MTEIMAEIRDNGPIVVGMTLWEDFFSYSSGVYHHVAGENAGGHAIKMLGWGVDKATGDFYWLCQNQWSEKWGDKGFFKIGLGEVGIDAMGLACDPDL